MQIGIVGLGKMGLNMVRRLARAGHEVVALGRHDDALRAARDAGASAVPSAAALVAALRAPRAVWVMVPAGEATEGVVTEFAGLLSRGDIVIDGGNSFYRDSQRRATALADRGLHYLDSGTSGGLWGLEKGYCLMIGGEAPAVQRLAPIFEALAPPDGWRHVGPSGAGHYVKMVHNGIEYGLMQAYAEGFELLRASGFGLDLGAIADLWGRGSVVRSWLLELCASALARNPDLEGLRPFVEDSGEGRWTVLEAVEKAVPLPVISESLFARFRSRQDNAFGSRLLAALRAEFGGHAVRKA